AEPVIRKDLFIDWQYPGDLLIKPDFSVSQRRAVNSDGLTSGQCGWLPCISGDGKPKHAQIVLGQRDRRASLSFDLAFDIYEVAQAKIGYLHHPRRGRPATLPRWLGRGHLNVYSWGVRELRREV